ncbi:hypothetical protein M427DRAFT_389576 [Gonapodya prolifera JEL478]|uniref:HAD-like protein n=1 Tax=Gonapodya prolifera (strain JEL478) TaxID=1344416 RepID=A0A139A8R5_GONPJ|nr:hypothetical protein M427DRAFT_389576 [Gonapodya prolifera JEL478]|eukprot:KXS12845.1 hypothetical protein M427DRAFT_389576 [Gonapodya prolifera JEL478]
MMFFSDFDGTISHSDPVVELLALAVGSRAKALALTREIMLPVARQQRTYREGFDLAVANFAGIDETTGLKTMVDAVHIDSTFSHFYDFCHSVHIPFVILSSGFANVIEKSLDLFLPNRSGASTSRSSTKISVVGSSYAHDKSQLLWKVRHVDDSPIGHDKSVHLVKARNTINTNVKLRGRVPIVYFGDGLNDIGPAEVADIVFAKAGSSLDKQCTRRGIQRRTFRDFAEVEDVLGQAFLIVNKLIEDQSDRLRDIDLIRTWRDVIYTYDRADIKVDSKM